VASRAEPRVSASPGLRGALRDAVEDVYFNSWRLVPANVLWGATFVVLAVGVLATPFAIILVPLLALPTVGICRMAALAVRGGGVSFWDGFAAWRSLFVPTILLGTAITGCVAVLGSNLAAGLASGNLVGWALATLAFWGLIGTWIVGWTAWPLLVDPARADQPVRARLRLAVLLGVARPGRMLALGALLALIVAISTIAFAALLTISVAFAALLASRVVLPAADDLEARLRAAHR
jgi:uncharacterized membrane protein YesL